MLKVAMKVPVEVAGVVVSIVSSKAMVTAEPGSNPAPEISTDVPTGPESGSRKMIGFTKAVTVNVFEAELEP